MIKHLVVDFHHLSEPMPDALINVRIANLYYFLNLLQIAVMKTIIYSFLFCLAIGHNATSQIITTRWDTLQVEVLSNSSDSLTYLTADSTKPAAQVHLSQVKYYWLEDNKYLVLDRFGKFTSQVEAPVEDKTLVKVPMKDGKFFYETIVSIPTKNKVEIYRRAKRWIAKNYTSANAVIQLDDPDGGEIIGKGIHTHQWGVTIYSYTDVNVHHLLRIQCKDEKARITYTDFKISYFIQPDKTRPAQEVQADLEPWCQNRKANKAKFLYRFDKHMNNVISDLKKSLENGETSDW